MERLDGRGIRIVVDATKNLLRRVLKYRPFLIKPNNHELGEMFGAELKTDDEIVFHAKKTAGGRRDKRAHLDGRRRWQFSSRPRGVFYRSAAPKGTLVNSVGRRRFDGCGLPRGLHGIGRQLLSAPFTWGVAAGSASAFSPNLATRAETLALLKTIV